jgi:NADPH:quinone reductase-like Zn-dependent oxidoreductase
MTMKAAVCPRYGTPDVLDVREVAKPTPGPRDLLVRVHAVSVTITDLRMRSGAAKAPFVLRTLMRAFLGFGGPRKRILGFCFAGTVEEVGKRATGGFQVGDKVYTFNGMKLGGFAEYARVRSHKVVDHMPAGLTFEQAAAIPYGGILALLFLRRAAIREGDDVVVYGASGAVGTAAVQIARSMGARVTAVCSAANFGLVTALGAESTIDYTTVNSTGGRKWDVVFDAAGLRKTSPLKESLAEALEPGGRAVSVDRGFPRLRPSDLAELSRLVEAGKLKPVIDRSYPLEQIAEAHRYVELGHKKGNVLLTL